MALQYVVLEHTVGGEAHFDLLLEVEGQDRLRTLQLPQWPVKRGDKLGFKELSPHRRTYLTYQGDIGGNRGSVRRIESGSWSPGPNGSIRLAPMQGEGFTLLIAGDKLNAL
jgi:hypothetical protein